MDLKSFGEEEFDPKKWINKAWSISGNQDKEVFVANTVSRLQLYTTQLTNSLDETTTQIVASIPRVVQDASTLQLAGVGLQQQLLALERKVLDVEEETGQSIASLQRIDQLKTRLENAASALREADKWAALATSLEDTLETGVPTQKDKLAELTEQVAAMTASLEVLSDAPDYETKRLQLETMYNRLEAAISAPLIEALTQMDADKTTQYVLVFGAMGRLGSLAACWRLAGGVTLAAEWRRSDAHCLALLRALFDKHCSVQVEWLSNVLKADSPLAELVRLYTDLLLSLEPTPCKVVSANLKLCSTPEEGILLLTDVRAELDQLVAMFAALLDGPRSSKEKVTPAALRELGRAIYAPLRELLPKYTDLQTQMFLTYLEHPDLNTNDLLECSRAFQNIVERSENWLNNAHGTAKKIAGYAIYPYFMPSVDAYTSGLTSRVSTHSRRIEEAFLSSREGLACFPAALGLRAAVGAALDLLAGIPGDVEVRKEENPLLCSEDHLLDEAGKHRLTALIDSPELPSVPALKRAGVTLKTLAVNVLREPVRRQLEKVPTLSIWTDNDALSTDLPDYAISPQEYITEVGQYLMTLPQHLEMHLIEKQAPWQYLTEVCNHTCDLYAEKLLTVRSMDTLGTRRCLTDIAYLSSVVEDLGGSITPALANLERDMRATQTDRQTHN